MLSLVSEGKKIPLSKNLSSICPECTEGLWLATVLKYSDGEFHCEVSQSSLGRFFPLKSCPFCSLFYVSKFCGYCIHI